MVIARRLALAAVLAAFALGPAAAAERFVVLASTTSTEQSGLFSHILPVFKAKTGIDVRVIAVGTGQALDIARRGDADVALVHDREAEQKFVAEGHALARHDVMHNDFVVVGPKGDPARAGGGKDASAALRRIAEAQAPFVSRGDRSGTHMAELRLWRAAGIDPAQARGGWYREIGAGMGPALNAAAAMGAYTLSDRGTWLSFKNRGEMAITLEGDERLFNPYGVMAVNPQRHPHVKADLAKIFVDWILSSEGQSAIAGYRVAGEPLFFPAARKTGS
jgi:tungstate transport system substrate-binding protein